MNAYAVKLLSVYRHLIYLIRLYASAHVRHCCSLCSDHFDAYCYLRIHPRNPRMSFHISLRTVLHCSGNLSSGYLQRMRWLKVPCLL